MLFASPLGGVTSLARLMRDHHHLDHEDRGMMGQFKVLK